MNTKILDIISKSSVIFTSVLIFLGIISSVVFYRAFSINILDQITIGEALLLFISRFSSFAISAIFGVVISRLFFISPSKNRYEKSNSLRPEDLKLSVVQKIYAVVIIIPLFILSIHGFLPFEFWIIPVSLIIRLYVLFYITKRLKLIFHNRNFDLRIIEFIEISGISLIIIVTIAMHEAYSVYNQKTGKEVTLEYTNGEFIKSDTGMLYLGKTESFYYFYDKPHNKAIILKSDEIKKMEITDSFIPTNQR